MINSLKYYLRYNPLLQTLLIIALLSLCSPSKLLAQENRVDRVSALCDSGFVLLERGDFEGAQKVFTQALRIDRDAPRALYGMGRSFLGLPKGGNRALDYLRRAAEKMPDDIGVHYYKALAHMRFSRTDIVFRDNARQAIEELEKVLAINPSHPNAYFMIGELYRDIFEDYESAIEAFNNQIAVSPDHIDAWQALLAAKIDIGEWDAAVETAEAVLARTPDMLDAYPFLAAAHWKAGKFDESMVAFERFFARLPEEERNLYFDLGYVLTPREQREFAALDDEGRNVYWRNYWRTRDPDPKTTVNERLLEHFIRVAYARVEFGKVKWPWDDRGDFMIRYGEPDERMDPGKPFPSILIDEWEFYLKQKDLCLELGIPPPWFNPEIIYTVADIGFQDRVDGSGTPERWLYIDEGIDMTFGNPVMSGNYITIDRELEMALELHIPVMSEEEEKIETFDPLQSAVTFRGRDGKTALEYSIGLLEDHIGQFRSITGEYAYINAHMELFTTDWRPVADTADSVHHMALRPQVSIRGEPLFVHGTRLEVDPGEYVFSTMIMDAETGIRSTNMEDVVLPDYSGDELMISDILPAAKITEVGPGHIGRFVRGELEVIPLPGKNIGKDQPLFVYFEIYNLIKDLTGATRYRIEYAVAESRQDVAPLRRVYQGLIRAVGLGQRQAVLSSEFTQSGIRPEFYTFLEIDMSEPPHGVYELIVTITDLNSRQTASSALTFRTLPMPGEPPNTNNHN